MVLSYFFLRKPGSEKVPQKPKPNTKSVSSTNICVGVRVEPADLASHSFVASTSDTAIA